MNKLIVLLIIFASLNSSQIFAGIMYINDGDGHNKQTNMYAVDMSTGIIVDSWNSMTNNRNFPIAIYGDIRTTGYASGETGAQYDLSGNLLAGSYALPNIVHSLSDGTSDGLFNYGISWNTGNVYQFDRDWTNPNIIFGTGEASGGITYDQRDDSFWTSGDRGVSGIKHFDRNGNLLGLFDTNEVGSSDWDLALDPTDNTLWVSSFRTNTFHNYATDGSYLGQMVLNLPTTASSFYSAEFNLATQEVPEPSTLAIFALGMIGLASRRFKKQS